jgi:hypothetical protein
MTIPKVVRKKPAVEKTRRTPTPEQLQLELQQLAAMAQQLAWNLDDYLDSTQCPGVVANGLLQAVRYARSSTKQLHGAAHMALVAEEIERSVGRGPRA